jgi:MFS family permease
MASFQPADNLRSRTFIGMLIAQFLAAFNDQAIHAAAMFFAINTQVMHEAQAITWMPVLFYAPWALFGTVAGFLADRYSKQRSLVFWKVAEVVIALITVAGFWVGRHGHPAVGTYLVLSTVFLMGTHSAFFVPAKYGAMPEILTARMLSRGNGLLESLSFLAVILGTVVGGILSWAFRGNEVLIGLILLGLAIIGALASLLIQRMPAANPTRSFPPYLYGPLVKNIRLLLSSRPLAFAVVGIAFFTFLVAFMRATVYMHGQSQVPPWSELRTSLIVGMVALGIGIGSPLVGFLSGGKVEVGLVPVGAVGMMVATSVAALSLGNTYALIACIILIGFFTGFYLVPLFTLLQHRAPKTSKGDAIATSNFINVTGAILASGVFAMMDYSAIKAGLAPAMHRTGEEVSGTLEKVEYKKGHPCRALVGTEEITATERKRRALPPFRLIHIENGVSEGDDVVVRAYVEGEVTYYKVQSADEDESPVRDKSRLPQPLFLAAGLLTALTLLALWRLQPDVFLRTHLWAQSLFRYRLEVCGMNNVPPRGPAILVTDAPGAEACLRVLSATDRVTHFLMLQENGGPLPGYHLAVLSAGETSPEVWEELARKAKDLLARGEVIGLSLNGSPDRTAALLDELMAGPVVPASGMIRPDGRFILLDELMAGPVVPVVPVHYEAVPRGRRGKERVYIMGGLALPATNHSVEAVRGELERLRLELEHLLEIGAPITEMAEAH